MPLKYDQLQVYRDIVGTSACRIEVDSEGKTRGSWHPTGLAFHTDDHPSLDAKWRKDLSLGADHVLRESWITAGDAHYERRLALSCSARRITVVTAELPIYCAPPCKGRKTLAAPASLQQRKSVQRARQWRYVQTRAESSPHRAEWLSTE